MIFRRMSGLFMLMVMGSCIPQPQKGEETVKDDLGQQQGVKTGLRIENSPNRGLNYTDPSGTKFSYRYIPITITNGSTIAINIQMALSKEYDYPDEFGEQKFKVFLLPKGIISDKVTYDTLSYELGDNELRNFFDKNLNPPYILNKTLEPSEKCEITMGTLYPRPTNCGVLPNVLFLQENRGFYSECEGLISQDYSISSPLALGLKIDFCSSCAIIACGQISYPEH